MGAVIKRFQERMDELKAQCKLVGQGLRGQDQLPWMLLEKAEGAAASDKPGKFDFDGIHDLFDRSEAEEAYVQAITGEGGNDGDGPIKQDLALASNQSDVLSGLERDFLARHRTRIRRLAHEATAKRHGGSVHGMVQSSLLTYVEYQLSRVAGGNGSGGGNGNGND
jgi:hypothetical protein